LLHWWFAIFLAWAVKSLVLAFGGHNVYRRSIPFFLGMIMGHITWLVAESALNLIFKTVSTIGWS
jgi:hypothetical protein